MRIVLSSLLILAHLLCFSLPSAALDTYGTDVGLQINDRVTGDSGSSGMVFAAFKCTLLISTFGSPGTTKVAPWACEHQAAQVEDMHSCLFSSRNPVLHY